MQMTTKEMATLMDWIAKGQITAREYCERMIVMETTIRQHVEMCHRTALIQRVNTDEDENPNQCDHPPIEWMKVYLEELRTMRDYERELRDHFCMSPDEPLIKELDEWWSSALVASQAADGTNPEPCEDMMEFADIVRWPLMKLENALYDGGLQRDHELKATVQNLTGLAKELTQLRAKNREFRLFVGDTVIVTVGEEKSEGVIQDVSDSHGLNYKVKTAKQSGWYEESAVKRTK